MCLVSRTLLLLLLVHTSFGQDAAQSRVDEEKKWADATGLSQFAVHRLWRMSSHFADEREDDSRIVNALVVPSRSPSVQDIILVTAAGYPYCITVTVLSHPRRGLSLIWSENQTPEGEGFCSNPGGDPEVTFKDGVISIAVPDPPTASAKTMYTVYRYGWVGNTYGSIGVERARDAQRKDASSASR
jgi:hypothetical protein